jgi:Spy/CpxP family protein refolding chaperone
MSTNNPGSVPMTSRPNRQAAGALFVATLLLAAPAGAEPAAMAEPGAGHAPAADHGAMPHDSWRDSLTGDQKAEIDLARLKLSQAQGVLRAQIELKRAEIDRMITSEDADQDGLQSRVDELVALERDRLTNHYRHLMEVRQLLTPKQRVAFDLDLLSPHRLGGHGPHP